MISVIVATYNPDWNKLCLTLTSIILQKGVDVEIIISDDGSRSFPRDKIVNWFDRFDFKNYVIRCSEKNKGILDNCYNGCVVAKGKYIKLISPGDYLFSDTILAEWMAFMEKDNICISFGHAVYYAYNQQELIINKMRDMPRVIKPYKYDSTNIEAQQLNYVLLGDVANGAAFMSEKDLLLKYFSKLRGRVIYAEDLAYRFMIIEGVSIKCFPANVIWYESGTGVSWNSGFGEKIDEDVKCFENIIKNNHYKRNTFAFKYKRYLDAIGDKKRGKLMKRLLRLRFFPKLIYWEEYRKIKTVYTNADVDRSYINSLFKICVENA